MGNGRGREGNEVSEGGRVGTTWGEGCFLALRRDE